MLKFGEQYLVLQSMERSKKKATAMAAAAAAASNPA